MSKGGVQPKLSLPLELRLVELSVGGKNNHQISQELDISRQTVIKYRRKHGLASRCVNPVRYMEPSIRTPSNVEMAYIAGLFDGEGTITQKSGNPSGIQVSISSTDKEVLNWLTLVVGGNVYSSNRAAQNRKQAYVWMLTRVRDKQLFLSLLAPYLKIQRRKDKAKNALGRLDSYYGKIER